MISTHMKNYTICTIVVVVILMILGFASCTLYNSPKYPLVGRWEYEDSGFYTNWVLILDRKYTFSLMRHHVEVYDVDDTTKNFFHYYETAFGTYSYSENIVTLHHNKIEHEEVAYINHEKEQKLEEKEVSYDEKAQFELNEKRDILTLVRNFGTDSAYTQTYYRLKFE